MCGLDAKGVLVTKLSANYKRDIRESDHPSGADMLHMNLIRAMTMQKGWSYPQLCLAEIKKFFLQLSESCC